MAKTKIYQLTKNNKPFYIGKTVRPLSKRLSEHQLNREDKDIQIKLIDNVPDDEWQFWERFYIQKYKDNGYKLENKCKGGNGPGRNMKINIESFIERTFPNVTLPSNVLSSCKEIYNKLENDGVIAIESFIKTLIIKEEIRKKEWAYQSYNDLFLNIVKKEHPNFEIEINYGK